MFKQVALILFGMQIALPAVAIGEEITPPGSTDAALTRWITGGWGGPDGRCQPYLDILYDSSGRYAEPQSEGRWRVRNGQLLLTVTRVRAPGSGRMRTLPRPRIERFRLLREGTDRMTQFNGGQAIRYIRCSEDTRPWTG
jgi:hypothetical protein